MQKPFQVKKFIDILYSMQYTRFVCSFLLKCFRNPCSFLFAIYNVLPERNNDCESLTAVTILLMQHFLFFYKGPERCKTQRWWPAPSARAVRCLWADPPTETCDCGTCTWSSSTKRITPTTSGSPAAPSLPTSSAVRATDCTLWLRNATKQKKTVGS